MPDEEFKPLVNLHRPVSSEVFCLIVDNRFRHTLHFLKLCLARDLDFYWDQRHHTREKDQKRLEKYFDEIFLSRLLHIMRNLANADVRGLRMTTAWYMTMKLELIHNDEIYLGVAANYDLDRFLLETFYGWDGKKPSYRRESYCKPIPFVDAARQRRLIREQAREIPGCPVHDKYEFQPRYYQFHEDECMQVQWVAAYSIFERQAYAETKRKVYHVVGLKLPRELADMVFDYALVAEDIPMDLKTYDEWEPEFEECGVDAYAKV